MENKGSGLEPVLNPYWTRNLPVLTRNFGTDTSGFPENFRFSQPVLNPY